METKNHKGTWCPYRELLCQEGICSGCEIYRDWKEQREKAMTKQELEQEIADYLTRQFIAVPGDVPEDECTNEAKHILSIPVIHKALEAYWKEQEKK